MTYDKYVDALSAATEVLIDGYHYDEVDVADLDRSIHPNVVWMRRLISDPEYYVAVNDFGPQTRDNTVSRFAEVWNAENQMWLGIQFMELRRGHVFRLRDMETNELVDDGEVVVATTDAYTTDDGIQTVQCKQVPGLDEAFK